MLVNGILILVTAVVVSQASRVNDEFFQELRDLLEQKDSGHQEDATDDGSNEVQLEVNIKSIILCIRLLFLFNGNNFHN